MGKDSASLVFCHNDINMPNTILDESTGEISFIDWEHGGYSYAAFDIANHFVEFAFECDLEKMDYDRSIPSKKFQMEWITCYLREKKRLEESKGAEEEEVNGLYEDVQKFMLCSHLLRSLWSWVLCINSQDSSFNYQLFAVIR